MAIINARPAWATLKTADEHAAALAGARAPPASWGSGRAPRRAPETPRKHPEMASPEWRVGPGHDATQTCVKNNTKTSWDRRYKNVLSGADENRTRNLLIWSQTRYHCATTPRTCVLQMMLLLYIYIWMSAGQ